MKITIRILSATFSFLLILALSSIITPLYAGADDTGLWSAVGEKSKYTKGNFVYWNMATQYADSDNPFADYFGFYCSYASVNDYEKGFQPSNSVNYIYGLKQINAGYPPVFQTSTGISADKLGMTCSRYEDGWLQANGASLSDDQFYPFYQFIKNQNRMRITGSSDKIANTLRSLWIEQYIFQDFTFPDLGTTDYSVLLNAYKTMPVIEIKLTDNKVTQSLIDAITDFKTKVDSTKRPTSSYLTIEIKTPDPEQTVVDDHITIHDGNFFWSVNGKPITELSDANEILNDTGYIKCDDNSTAVDNVVKCHLYNPTSEGRTYKLVSVNSVGTWYKTTTVDVKYHDSLTFDKHIDLYEYPGLSDASYEKLVPKGTWINVKSGEVCPEGSYRISGTDSCFYGSDTIIHEPGSGLVDDNKFVLLYDDNIIFETN